MANAFCKLLSNGYKITLSNDQLMWSPCCFWFSKKQVPLLDTVEFNKALNYTSTATDWLPECRVCQKMESHGVLATSPRLLSFEKVPDPVEDGKCVALEISFDVKCNAACLSCSPQFSSTWSKYNKKHNLINLTANTHDAEYFLNQFINNVDLTHVKDIFMMGGEPFYSDTHVKLLKHLVAIHPAPEKIRVRYQTNGSIVPNKEVIDLWSKFKLIILSISIDGIQDRFDYLRWPLKWNQVEDNVRQLLDIPNTIFNINATITPLNVLYFDEIENWATKFIPHNRLKNPQTPVRPCRGFQILDLNWTPQSLRTAVLDKYSPEHLLSKIFNNLEFNQSNQMIEYIEQHDQLRKLDWKKTFPLSIPYLTD
jgi:hypothetical protein